MTNDNRPKRIANNGIGAMFVARRPFKANNTIFDGTTLTLHGSVIAWWDERGDRVHMTLAGWPTSITIYRLNAILCELGWRGGFTRKQFKPHFNGRPISAVDIITTYLLHEEKAA